MKKTREKCKNISYFFIKSVDFFIEIWYNKMSVCVNGAEASISEKKQQQILKIWNVSQHRSDSSL